MTLKSIHHATVHGAPVGGSTKGTGCDIVWSLVSLEDILTAVIGRVEFLQMTREASPEKGMTLAALIYSKNCLLFERAQKRRAKNAEREMECSSDLDAHEPSFDVGELRGSGAVVGGGAPLVGASARDVAV